MPDTFHILCIDDEPVLHTLIDATLGFTYEVELAADGLSGLEMARRRVPDLVLLDIAMPGLPGYEVCRRLRQQESTRHVPVIFMSALDRLEDRLAAYDAGGDDFIGKPFDGTELLEKVEATLRRVAEVRRLEAEKSSALSTAMTALSMTGEMGVILAFLQKSFACDGYVSLADAILEATAAWELTAKVQVRGNAGTLSRNADGDSNPLEAGVLASLAACGRLAALGRRLSVSFEGVTILVDDMPLEDAERSGRMRDALAWLGEAADARVQSLDNELAVRVQRQTLHRLVDRTRDALADISLRHLGKKTRATDIMHDMLMAIEGSFFSLGLSESQEARVAETLREAVHKVVELYDEGLGMDAHLQAITAELNMAPPENPAPT